MQHELNKDTCLVCGAKHSITRVVQTVSYGYRVYCECAVCTSEYAGAEEMKLSRLLNKQISPSGQLLQQKEKPNDIS